MKFAFLSNRFLEWLERPVFRLGLLLLIALSLFAVTLTISNWFARYVKAVGQGWFARGELQVKNGHPEQAVLSYRTALTYSRENELYGLRLGEALAAAHLDNEARAYLRSLWERRPGDAVLNLELARIAARQGDQQEATRYFHGAIYGVWDQHASQQRRRARIELIDYLLQNQLKQQAESELIALLPEVPGDPAQLVTVADKFMQTGDYDRAEVLYRRVVIDTRGRDSHAKKGAAVAAFRSGQFRIAERYFKNLEDSELDPESRAMRDTAVAVVRLDPNTDGLRIGERAARVMELFKITSVRLKSCSATPTATSTPLPAPEAVRAIAATQWDLLKRRISVAKLSKSRALEDEVLRFVYDTERDAATSCGAGTTNDKAIALLASRNEAQER